MTARTLRKKNGEWMLMCLLPISMCAELQDRDMTWTVPVLLLSLSPPL
jgi:hypothetical protein